MSESLTQRAQKLLTPQFAWFIGHLVTALVSADRKSFYYRSYYGTLLSYGIILYKAHGLPQFNSAYAQKVVSDENSQYFLLSLIWVSSAPIYLTLLPYATFSLFHSLAYFKNEVVPKVPSLSNLNGMIGSLQKIQPSALNAIAYAEVFVILPNTVLAIFYGSSLFTPFLYFQFLSFRYMFSSSTKAACSYLESTCDSVVVKLPGSVKSGYDVVKGYVKSYGDLEKRARDAQPQPPPQ